MSTILKKAVGAVLCAALPMVTLASNLYGGGATYPAVPYVGSGLVGTSTRFACTVPGICTNASASITAASTSIFGTYATNYSAHEVAYCLTGSGQGKSTQIGTLAASGNCNPSPPVGLGSANARPNFVGTDSPYSVADYTAFAGSGGAGATKSAIVQIPSLVGTVVLPFRNPDIAGTTIALNTDTVCRIFAGVYTDWNQIPGLGAPSRPIRVVGRSDNSGTSFAFTNYAARRCNQANGGVIPPLASGDAKIKTNQSYTSSGLRVDLLESGNPAVVQRVYATDGAIGYSDPGDVSATPPASRRYARVDGGDPLGAFSSPALLGTQILTGQVIGPVTPSTGLPSTASAGSTIPQALTLVDPSLAVTSTYPIVAWTYLDAYARGNNQADVGSDANAAAALRSLFGCVHGIAAPACRPALPAGYAYVTFGDTAARSKVVAAIGQIQN